MLLRPVRDLLERRDLMPRGSSILVAVSGGVDSVVLFHLLGRLADKRKWRLAIGHLNHALRDLESDLDQALVKNLAEAAGCAFFTSRLNSDELKTVGNLQEKARDLRYLWLRRWAGEWGADWIATAHHANDQAETVLMNLSRGAGLDGLAGIPIKRDRIVRPLLTSTREEIENYAKAFGLVWREDASNQSEKYQRNRWRKSFLPLLEELSPGAVKRMAEGALRAAEAEEALREEAKARVDAWLFMRNGIWVLRIEHWNALAYGLRCEILREVGRRIGKSEQCPWNAKHIEQMELIASFPSRYKEMDLPNGFAAYGGFAVIHIQRKARKQRSKPYRYALTEDIDLDLPSGELRCFPVSPENLVFPKHEMVAFFDIDDLKGPLEVRSRKRGDMIRLPKLGTKSIARVLSDLKIPKIYRDSIPIVTDGQRILWVAGVRRSEESRISGQTQRALGIKFKPRWSKELDPSSINGTIITPGSDESPAKHTDPGDDGHND